MSVNWKIVFSETYLTLDLLVGRAGIEPATT